MIVTICIGNSDNCLTQQQWSDFVYEMSLEIGDMADKIHFRGGPPNNDIRQNYAWVVECSMDNLTCLKSAIIKIRIKFRQDNVAWIVGETEFV